MRPLKLHTKTTLLVSVITIAVLAAALAVANSRIATLVRREQKARAELQAINLAEHVSAMQSPRDPEALARAATLTRGARPGVVAVRIWERVGGTYVETARAAGSEPATELPEETRAALRSGLSSIVIMDRPPDADNSLYRVFVPVTEQGRVSGAVELVEQLDDAPSIAVRYEQTAVSIAVAAVVLITLATYLLFRPLIYRPIERLLLVMSRVEAGDMEVRVPERAPDELGRLSRGFNRMIGRVREMTSEREAQARLLKERVHEATGELARRNEQLEETNRQLWQTARRLTELERLAAAGQTAAQFAHEVGTPLNLISGHVQLLRARLEEDERAGARLDTISAQIERIERIVRRMLDRTRPESVELQRLDLNALLERMLEATAPLLEARRVHLVTELYASHFVIRGDADRLQQLFINLINNALDAMPDGGKLRVRTKRVGSDEDENPARAAVEFADTGCGMSNQVRSHIFDPLYTTKERGSGTGLGLVIVRQVLYDHGGGIEVESEIERGTLFRIWFPLAPLVREEVDDGDAERNRQKAEAL